MKRNLALDLLRLFAAFMVVGIHGHFYADIDLAVSNFLENYFFRIAVPIFLLASGYYFHKTSIKNKTSRPWYIRTIWLYSAWTLVYIFPICKESGSTTELIKILLLGYWHLWYLPAIILAAIVSQKISGIRQPYIWLGMGLAYLAGTTLQYIANYHMVDNEVLRKIIAKGHAHRNFLFFAFPFFQLGYLISRDKLLSKISNFQLTLILLAGIFGIMVEFVINSLNGLDYHEKFDMLFSLPLIALPVFAYALKSTLVTEATSIAGLSSAIYFSHPMILMILRKFYPSFPTLLALVTILISIVLFPAINSLNEKINHRLL